MDKNRGYANLGMLLDAIVAITLIGTFVIYGSAGTGNSGNATADPADVATLHISR